MHQYHIIEKGKPRKESKKALLLLHGRGASAHDIAGLADEFCDDSFYIVAPQATNHTWYPYSFLAPEAMNEPWLTSAVQIVKRLIDETSQYVPLENIYLMGFSQGACLTLEVTTRYAVHYAGIAAFTGGLIGEKLRTERYGGNFGGTKVFIGNSDRDPHVPVERSEETKKIMVDMGADVTLKVYPAMAHTITQEEINTVKNLMF